MALLRVLMVIVIVVVIPVGGLAGIGGHDGRSQVLRRGDLFGRDRDRNPISAKAEGALTEADDEHRNENERRKTTGRKKRASR